MPGVQFHYLKPLALISASLVALSVVVAASMLGEQESLTRMLSENAQSHTAAIKLRASLQDLIALEDDQVQTVSVLHDRILDQLSHIETYADQPLEKGLYEEMRRGFRGYLQSWQKLPEATDPNYEKARERVTRYLESDVLKKCEDFEAFNSRRLAESPKQHERVLRQLAWGMIGVGVMGGVAGLVLGYGIARALARSIQRLQVQLRDAAGKLGPEVPEIVLNNTSDFGALQADIEQLSTRIEQVVRELKARELEVLRAEQLAAVGQLAAGVAHEIRNPLTAIKLLVQAAREDGNGIVEDELRVIEDEVRRMERSLNTFLEFARPPKLQRSIVPLADLLKSVRDLVRIRAERQRVELRSEGDVGLAVQVDPEQLRQVLLNLAMNALDSMPSGGLLRIVFQKRGDRLEISVSDSGPGISSSILPRLFTPFASNKDTGLGLGLVISRRIIEDHGGTLTAANLPTGGAEFLICLPLEKA